jgi:hypothetical protein
MFALDLFNTKYEKELKEGAVDSLEARRIDDLNMRMLELLDRAKEPAYKKNPAALAGLKREFQKIKAERDSYFKINPATGMNDSGTLGTVKGALDEQGLSDSNPITGAVTRRILLQRPDLLKQYGPELVGAAIDNVADYVGDVDEIGSSDVSAWVAQVERMLKENPPEAFAESNALDQYRQRLHSQGFTDSPEERNADRLERKRRHNAALDKISNISGLGSEEEAKHQAQQRMARDEYDTQRRKDDDEDTRKTFDMMRDRLNRMQYKNQRDVDPKQLKKITSIKYNPIREGASPGVDAKGRTQAQWIQLVKTKFPDGKMIQAKMPDGPVQVTLPDGRKLGWRKVEQAVAEAREDREFFNNVEQWKAARGKLHTDEDRPAVSTLGGKIIAKWDAKGNYGWIDRSGQQLAEGAEQMTPNWAKYVLDQIYNSDGEVTLTDLFDEGIPGLYAMFMDTAQQHGLDPEEEFEDVQHELTLELEDLIKGGHDIDEEKNPYAGYKQSPKAFGAGNFQRIVRANMGNLPTITLEFPNPKDNILLDKTAIDLISDYYDGLQNDQMKNHFIYRVLPSADEVLTVLKKIGWNRAVQPDLPGIPAQGELPLQEKKKFDSNSDVTAGDTKVARELQKLRAQYPAAKSDVEAVAKSEIDSSERSQQQLAAIKGANTEQDRLLQQLIALDKKQGTEIGSLDNENDRLEQQLAYVEKTNAKLAQAIGQISGQARPSNTDTTQPSAIDLIPNAPADNAQTQQPIAAAEPESPVQKPRAKSDVMSRMAQDLSQTRKIQGVSSGPAPSIRGNVTNLDQYRADAVSRAKAAIADKNFKPLASQLVNKGVLQPTGTNESVNEDQRLHPGDPVVVTAPNEFEGKTGEIYDFSPSGSFVIVDLYNHGKHSMHLSDVAYNDHADQEEADDWYDEDVAEGKKKKKKKSSRSMGGYFFPGYAYYGGGESGEGGGDGGGESINHRVAETALNSKDPQGDYAAKRQALHDLSLNKDVDQAAVLQRRLDLDREAKAKGVTKGSINEFAPAGGGGSGNYFQALASAWYNGAFDTGSLQKGIKSKEDVERLLNRGVVGPDGATRKYAIDYNSNFDGVVISSDDYYEHSDYNDQGQEVDSRTGQLWGPYDYMEFSDDDLSEGMAEAQTDYQKRRQRERDIDAGRPVKPLPKNPQTDYARKRAKDRKDMEMGEGNYQHGLADPNAPGLGAQEKNAFKRQELQHELGHERNNIAIAINGKTWKVVPGKGYADSAEERAYLQGMQRWAEKKSASSGKKWTVSLTGANPTVNELSTEKLAQYKTAAALDAGAADKAGDYKRGDKRFSGIVKATKKQFANDVKKHKDQGVAEGLMKEPTTRKEYLDQRDKLFRMMAVDSNPANKQIIKQALQDLEARYGNLKNTVKEESSTASEAVERAILNRIMVAHTDLLMKFGPDKVMQAAEEVAYNVGDVDEIGTSDVSAYVNQVKQILGA